MKRLELQYFDWPIPDFNRFIKANHEFTEILCSNASVNSSGAHSPPGICRAFAHVSIPGVGHLKFYHCPGVGHLPTPGTTPGHLTSLSGFGLACNIWILKLSKMITFVKIFYDFGRLINTDNAFSVPR